MRKYFIILLILTLISCGKVPLTGRKQMILLPESQVMALSLTSYKEFLGKNPALPATDAFAQKVRIVGQKISIATENYLRQKGYANRLAGYKWEFNAVNNKEVNAWCMPGGKVVAYTGIWPVAKDDAGLAVVLSHEIAHAIAEHGNERMSQQLALQVGAQGLDIALQKQPDLTRNIFLTSYGVGSQLGILAYSREHELEADRLGLIFMAMAGYNPERALTFWQDMKNVGGAKPPEFLSTHPSDANRIEKVKKYLPEAKKYYKP
ncbi:MAG: M48 family metallopeptidase [Bacteroidota bacterium]